MKLKLTLVRPGNDSVDLTVTAEPTTAVSEIARELYNADPSRRGEVDREGGRSTLRVHSDSIEGRGAHIVIDPAVPLADSGLASGVVVSIAPSSERSESTKRVTAAALVTVTDGPEAGRVFELPVGSSSIGRDAVNRIQLQDPLVSKVHVRVNVTDSVEIIDAGSANGTLVNGEQVDRVAVVSSDRITLGDTTFTVVATAHAGAVEQSGVVHFNRSPRLDPTYPGIKLKAPEPPEKPRPARLPYLALLAPLIMGGVLLAVNPGNPLSVVFIALSPLILIAGFIDNLIQGRKQWKQAKKEFEDSVQAVDEDIDRLHREEREGRASEAPSMALLVADSMQYGHLLWTRRPEHESFLALRLGLGRMPSRHEFEMPGQRKGPPELWRMVEALSAKIAFVEPAPAVENFAASGSIGVAGPLETSRSVARGLVAQLTALHSPSEISVVAIASTLSAQSWDWLKWLPHVGSAFSPISAAPLATGGPAAGALVSAIEDLIATRAEVKNDGKDSPVLPIVVVIVEDDAPVDRPRLVGLAESGPSVGVHLMWVAPSLQRLPAACRTFVDIDPATSFSIVGYVHTGYGVRPVACEALSITDAGLFARALAPVVDASARADDASDLPASVSFLALVGTDIARDPEAVISRWQETHSIVTGPRAVVSQTKIRPNLRAVFGQASNEPFAVDLRTDGPHALVGGTTGSGKSEFLQAWVLGLAAAHSPSRVTFLFVDYKGGAAFADCLDLPHTVGLVTDLSQHLVRRALQSLRAELHFRERLFARKKVKDIIEFEKTGDAEVPPSLIIVVDEFAALATEVPEFVDGVVDVAQRGRSLGLHLILATQRPAGVIKDNLRANTPLRIALRMADESDSTDVLGTPLAAGFDPSLPGRAAAKTGPGRVKTFQSGYAGGWTGDTPPAGAVGVEELAFGSSSTWASPPDPEAAERQRLSTSGPTDIKRIVSTVRAAADAAEIALPRKPWLPELATVYDFSKLPNKRTDVELLLGVVDDAAGQSQPVINYVPDRDGNMAIIGTGGSGKSTALRTIAVAAAVTMRGGPVQVFGLDFGAGGLQMLETLPHVGAVISGDDDERVARLLRWLRDLVDDRAVRYAAARAGTIVDYRTLASRPDEPRILLLLDGMSAFREAYESNISTPWFSVFSQIATDGRQVGVHVIVTGDRAGSIPTSLSSTIQRRLVLRLANADDYGMLGVESDILNAASPPGRGILDGHETQIAVLGGDSNVAVQARQIDALASSMTRAGVSAAPSVERLSDHVMLSSLPVGAATAVPIGIADDNLQPISIEPVGPFVISGPPGSGRTTALRTVAQALSRSAGSPSLFLLSPRRSGLTRLKIWAGAADSPSVLDEQVSRLAGLVDGGGLRPGQVALFLENLADFSGTPVEYDLERVLRALLRAEQFVVAEAETSTWSQAYTLGQPLRAGRKGLILQPDEGEGDVLLNTSLGRIRRGTFPVGRGFVISNGRGRKVQVAAADDGGTE